MRSARSESLRPPVCPNDSGSVGACETGHLAARCTPVVVQAKRAGSPPGGSSMGLPAGSAARARPLRASNACPHALRAAQVTEEASGRVYSGRSPTHPWTQVCLAQRTGQRISGAPPGPLPRCACAAGLPEVMPARTCLCPARRSAAPDAPAGTLPHKACRCSHARRYERACGRVRQGRSSSGSATR